MSKKKNRNRENEKNHRQNMSSGNDLDQLSQRTEQNDTRKPGSQSYSSKQNNNGRGGGR